MTAQKVGYSKDDVAVDYEMPSQELLSDLKVGKDDADYELQAYMARTEKQRENERKRTDDYIMTRREFSRAKYNEKSASVIKDIAINEEDISFKSQYAPMIVTELTAEQIINISNNIEVETIYYDDVEEFSVESKDSFDNIELFKSVLSYNDVVNTFSNVGCTLNGEGVTIGVAEVGGLLQESSELDPSSIEMLNGVYLCEDSPMHATNVTRLIMGTSSGFAKGARVINSHCGYEDVEELIRLGADIINMSFSNKNTTNRYNNFAHLCDHYASYNNVIIVAATCNTDLAGGRRVFAPAIAFNVIAVGAYHLGENQYTENLNDDIVTNACGYNNEGYAEKPDVLLPGGSTSYATPILTSCIALALQLKPALAVYPQAVKAIVMASCHRKVLPANESDGVETMTGGITEHQGAGVFDMWTMFSIVSQGTYGVGMLSDIASQDVRRFVVPNKNASNMNVSVTWLKDVARDDAAESDIVNLDLYVYRNNQLVGSSKIGSQSSTDNRISSTEMAYISLSADDFDEYYEFRIEKAEEYYESYVRYGYAYSTDVSYISQEEGEEGIYYIRNYYTNKYLTLSNNEAVMSNFTGADNQKWVVSGTNGNYELMPAYATAGTKINFGTQIGSTAFYKAVTGTSDLDLSINSWETEGYFEPDTYVFTTTSEGNQNILGYSSSYGAFARSASAPAVNMLRMWMLEDINYRVGDADMDGIIDSDDVLEVQNYVGGNIAFNNLQYYLADYNNDGTVNIKDSSAINRYLSQINN